MRREEETGGDGKKKQTGQEKETKRGDATATRGKRMKECTISIA
jgi:hypothetical protein